MTLSQTARPPALAVPSRPDAVDASTAAISLLMARVAGIDPASAERLLAAHGTLRALRHADPSALCAAHGLTARQAARLHDALTLAEALRTEGRAERPRVTTARDAARLLLPGMGLLETEQMRVLLLDARNRLITVIDLYTGTVSACPIRVAEIFRAAVRFNASALLLAHNHPSADPAPSPEDVAITRAVVQAGRLLDVDVLDHLIVGGDTYTSLRERGLGWP